MAMISPVLSVYLTLERITLELDSDRAGDALAEELRSVLDVLWNALDEHERASLNRRKDL